MPQLHRMSIVLAAVLVSAAAARADLSATDVKALGDADFSTRQAAMRKLLADEAVTPDQIAKAFPAAESVEQKHRLITLARHHLLRLARQRDFPFRREPGLPTVPGALGLTHGPVTSDELPQLKQSGVRIRRTLPGFPAHAALETGDLILAIEGNPLPANFTSEQISRYFGDAIQMVQAGQTVTLSVHRDGKTVDVKVKLAPHAALSGMYQPELRSVYEKEWAAYREMVLREGK